MFLRNSDDHLPPDWLNVAEFFVEKLIVPQLFRKFQELYGTRMFIPLFTRALDWPLY
jgi:hypothetical protein